MGIDTGSAVGFNSIYPIAGVNQSSKTFRDNFAIIKTAIERLHAAGASSNSIFSVSMQQATDGQVSFVVTLKNNLFTLPVGDPTVAPVLGSIRYNSGQVQVHNGSAWVNLLSNASGSIAAALGFTPAPIASPAFTGVPTGPTAAIGTNTTQLATTAFVHNEIGVVLGAAPSALDTLNELAAALNNDPDFANTMINGLAGKAATNHTHSNYLSTINATSGSATGNTLSVVGANGLSTSITGSTLTIGLNASTAHGNLAGGTFHALAIANGAAGFMSGTDKAKLDGISGTGNAFSRMIISNDQGLNIRDATTANDSFVFSSDLPIVLTTTGNEVHFGYAGTDASHGFRAGGQLHAVAAPNGDAGFMSGTDKAKLDALTVSTATTSVKGYMSPGDKTKLDNLVLQTGGGYTTLNVNGTNYQISGDNILTMSGINGLDLDYHPQTKTLYFVLNSIGGNPIQDFIDVRDNYNAANDRDDTTIPAPIVKTDGTAVDHVVLPNASVSISFEWTWPGPDSLFTTLDEDGEPVINTPPESSIDGFQIYVYRSNVATTYSFGNTVADEMVFTVPAYKRSFILNNTNPNDYYTFFIRAYRRVDGDISASGLILSTPTGCTRTEENPYRPTANVAFAGDVTGTIDGAAATTVKSNAIAAWGKFSGVGDTLPSGNVEFNFAASGSKGGNALNTNAVGSQSATTVQNATINFNSRNDRIGTALIVPSIASDGTAIDHTLNTDGSANLSFEWTWSGVNEEIDGFIIYIRQSTSGASYILGTTASEETVYYVTPEKRAFFLYGIPSDLYYTIYIQSYRIVDNDVSSSGFLRSAAVKSTLGAENPYRPSATAAFTGDLTGTINGTSAAVLQQNATNAWGKFSGAGNSLPAGNVEFNFANSSTKGGNALNTDFVGSQSATTVQTSIINFNNRNDRNGTAITAPTIATDGTSIDHTVNTDGSANISFEWLWAGSAADIDGFIVTVYQSSSATAYVAGTDPANESVNYVTPEKRAITMFGVSANSYYTFFLEAYRIVDTDVNASGFIKTTKIKPTRTEEDPYRPAASVSFAGDLSGTINGVSAATVQTAAQLAAAKFSGSGGTLPAGNVEFNFATSGSKGGNALNTDSVGSQGATTVQNAVINFNSRNDRLSSAVVAPAILTDGTAIDHTVRSNGSCDISFEWTWGGTESTIDGFIVFVYASTSSTPYSFGTSPAEEMVQYCTPEKRAFILYGIAPDLYYTFGIKAYRIVDTDINASGVIASAIVKSSRGEENPYRPATAPVFSGDITGTINGQAVSVVLGDVDTLKSQVSSLGGSGASEYALNKNPSFAVYPTTGVPTNWTELTASATSRTTGLLSTYGARIAGAAFTQSWLTQTVGTASVPVIVTNEWVVIEATVRLVSGTFVGAGMIFRTYNTSNSAGSDQLLTFSTDVDATNTVVGNGTVGNLYTFTKLMRATQANAAYFQLFAVAHSSTLGSVSAANSIDFYRASVRPAFKGEVDSQTALTTANALTSTVGTYSGAISDLQGKTSAYLTLETNSGSLASAFVKLQSQSSPGVTTSSVAIGATEFHVYNPVGANWTKALSVVGGILYANGIIANSAQIQDGLITNAKIGNLEVDSAKIANLTVGTQKIALNAVSVPWLATSGSTINFASGTKTLLLSVSIMKYDDSSILEVHGQAPMFGNDAVDLYISYEVYDSTNTSLYASRTFTLKVDANGTTYLPFAFEHYFDGLLGGSYNINFYAQRFSSNACSTAGLYHMRVREFKR